ncbi:phosphotransferase [Paenibacillus tianmuensis]
MIRRGCISMRPNREVKGLSRKFGIRVRRMKIIQNGVYQVVTTKGKVYCLKRMSYPPTRLRWIDKTLGRLRRHGFPRIVWRNPREYSGKHLFVKWFHHSPPFVLHPWLKGSWPSPKSRSQMKACGTLLARFHRTGKRITIPKAGINNMSGKWYTYLQNEQKVLQKAFRKAKRNGFRSPLDRLLQAHGKEILQMGKASLRSLRNSDYRSICRKTKATLCHGDCGPTNIIRSANGMYLIDFETLRLDLRAYDLYRIIFNSCIDHGWNFSIVKSILDGYQKVFKLTTSDYQMLKIWLRFPRGICKLIVHYDQKSPKEKLQIERDFPRFLADERKRKAMFKQLDAYAKKRIG